MAEKQNRHDVYYNMFVLLFKEIRNIVVINKQQKVPDQAQNLVKN